MSPGFFSFPTFHHTTRVVHSRAIVQCNAALCELYAFSSHLPRINHKYLKSFTIPRATARSQPRGISPFSQRARLTAQMGTECKTKKKKQWEKTAIAPPDWQNWPGVGGEFLCCDVFHNIYTAEHRAAMKFPLDTDDLPPNPTTTCLSAPRVSWNLPSLAYRARDIIFYCSLCTDRGNGQRLMSMPMNTWIYAFQFCLHKGRVVLGGSRGSHWWRCWEKLRSKPCISNESKFVNVILKNLIKFLTTLNVFKSG